MIPAGIPPIEYAKTMLMSRGKIPMHWKVDPEQRICIEFADRMRGLVLSGRYRGVFCHLANEGKRHQLTALVMKAMGMITGAPDYVFMWKGGNGLIEFKAGRGKQTESQAYFQMWAESESVAYALCRSSDEALDTLRAWGAI